MAGEAEVEGRAGGEQIKKRISCGYAYRRLGVSVRASSDAVTRDDMNVTNATVGLARLSFDISAAGVSWRVYARLE